MAINWLKQTAESPLYPDLLWSRPENRANAGKILIIGGNSHGFSDVASSYQKIERLAGQVHILIPDKLKPVVGRIIENGDYGPSTPSGSFAKNALSVAMELATWADNVVLAGDFGRNSETSVMIEAFAKKYRGGLLFAQDAIDALSASPDLMIDRDKTVVVGRFSQIQRIAQHAKSANYLSSAMDVLHISQNLSELTTLFKCAVVTTHLDKIIVAYQGRVSLTQTKSDTEDSLIDLLANCSVWQAQNQAKLFESLTCAAYEYINSGGRGGNRTLNPLGTRF